MAKVTVQVTDFNYTSPDGKNRREGSRFRMEQADAESNPCVQIVNEAAEEAQAKRDAEVLELEAKAAAEAEAAAKSKGKTTK